MRGVALAPPPDAAPANSDDRRLLQRSEDVLWSIAPPGVMLHHLGLGVYLELDALGYALWAYLDGARSVDEAVLQAAGAVGGDGSLANAWEMLSTLDHYGFVIERPTPGNAL